LGKRSFVAVVLLSLPLLCAAGGTNAHVPPKPGTSLEKQIATIRGLLNTPDDQLDLATSKLTIDRLYDPTLNVASAKQQIGALAMTVRKRLPANPSIRDKIIALLSTLYDRGPWNGNHPFSYDLDDPLGEDLRNRLLSRYLATRKGNCVSMPILVAILAQKLGIQATLATAPAHMLMKFRDDRGVWMNVEATSGYVVNDSFYPPKEHISQQALASGIYLRPLSQKGAIGAMLSTLMISYDRRRPEAVIALANLALEANPKDASAMIFEANAYYDLFKKRYTDRYPDPKDIPAAELKEAIWMSHQNPYWGHKAQALGWVQETPQQTQEYLDSVAREKARREQAK